MLLAAAWAPGVPPERSAAALALVAVPAAEVAFAVVRRLRGRRSVLAGDRGHPYDRLVDRGWPRPAASLGLHRRPRRSRRRRRGRRPPGHAATAVVVDVAAAALLVALAALTGASPPDALA